MKRIALDELLKQHKNLSYEQQYALLLERIRAGELKPVKASGTNGKKPALYREYWLPEEKKDYSAYEEELKYRLLPILSIDYYIKHPELYEQDRPWVLMLNDYLKDRRDCLQYQASCNERSFEIWNREKFLTREQGRRVLKRCGLPLAALNIYGTTEPLAYYSHTRKVPQNLLILENKDTFYSMRRHLLQEGCPLQGGGSGPDPEDSEISGPKPEILGMEIGTLIYGAGKGVLRSFQDFSLCVEPYMKAAGNRIYYFGDLDYEGIGIYENLAELFRQQWEILPFRPGYEAMLRKAQGVGWLPETKEQQNRNIRELFFSYFPPEQARRMREILEQDTYIPQEILNIADF